MLHLLPHGYGIPSNGHWVGGSHLAEDHLANMESKGSIMPLHRVAITVGQASAHQCPVADGKSISSHLAAGKRTKKSVTTCQRQASVSLSLTF